MIRDQAGNLIKEVDFVNSQVRMFLALVLDEVGDRVQGQELDRFREIMGQGDAYENMRPWIQGAKDQQLAKQTRDYEKRLAKWTRYKAGETRRPRGMKRAPRMPRHKALTRKMIKSYFVQSQHSQRPRELASNPWNLGLERACPRIYRIWSRAQRRTWTHSVSWGHRLMRLESMVLTRARLSIWEEAPDLNILSIHDSLGTWDPGSVDMVSGAMTQAFRDLTGLDIDTGVESLETEHQGLYRALGQDPETRVPEPETKTGPWPSVLYRDWRLFGPRPKKLVMIRTQAQEA
jgi:hypothetical protein